MAVVSQRLVDLVGRSAHASVGHAGLLRGDGRQSASNTESRPAPQSKHQIASEDGDALFSAIKQDFEHFKAGGLQRSRSLLMRLVASCILMT